MGMKSITGHSTINAENLEKISRDNPFISNI